MSHDLQNKGPTLDQSRFHSSFRKSVAVALVLGGWGAHAGADERALPEVQVQTPAEQVGDLPGPYPGGQMARGAHLGVLGKTDVMDAPFSVISFTGSVIHNSQSRSISEVIGGLDSSVREEYGDGTSLDTLMIRGFTVENDEMSLNGLPGILGQFRVSPEFVERAEVLKGPSALINGMSADGSVGGAVNLISKRAGDVPLTSLTMGYASHSLFGFNADIARRFGVDNAFGIRVNAGARQGDMQRDYMTDRARNLSIGMDFNSERLRASLDLIRQTQRLYGAGGAVDFSAVGGPVPAAPDGRRNFAQPWYFQDAEDTALMGRVEWDVSKHLTVFGAIGQSRDASSALVADEPFVDASGGFAYAGMPIRWRQRTISSQWGLKGQFDTGSVRHHWSLTASDLRRTSTADFHVAGLSGGAGLSSIYDMVLIPPPGDAVEPAGPLAWSSRNALPGYAIADTLSFAEGRLRVTLGVRHQRVKSDSATGFALLGMSTAHYDESVNSPMATIVFKPSRQISLYANHVQGLSMGDTAPYGTSNQGVVFAPYRTRQFETGMKFDAGRFGGTLSVFQITKPYATIDPSTLTFGVFGKQRHRGVEVQLFGELAKGVRLIGGATFMNAEVRDPLNAAGQTLRPVGVARRQLALQGEWDVPAASGLTLTAHALHSGDVYADATNFAKVPGWTVYDLGARYVTRLGNTQLTLRAMVKNVTDERYWKQGRYAATLGMPRTLALSSTFEF
ncbi:TonB-dependent receptor [Diaphorobacter caeni]|uniref:TonB-dependent receptor n=1 Tax=Diaphorobacter caeni TaxID=2784387 RepID=UPI0018904F9A|nr:TonB-dependent siderophore receptor [Diaphorobacter caeni]MBF5003328.1 TonB-dependent siderophore receptor [Diaphorobacter caeni]